MKYFQNPNNKDDVFGFDETDSTQLPYMEEKIQEGYVDISDSWPPKVTKEQTINLITSDIQTSLDFGAQKWGYDSIVSAASYVNSTNTQYAADANALIKWRDDVWSWAIPLFPNVKAGGDPETFLKDMPKQPKQPSTTTS